MLMLQGTHPFSTSRLRKLTDDLNKKQPHLQLLDINTVYFVLAEELPVVEIARLTKILDCGQSKVLTECNDPIIVVTPRFGTISPWSSKATEILQVCGFNTINRIERGILYRFNKLLTQEDLNSVANTALLHDKMTESLSLSLNLDKLFNEENRNAVEKINLLGEGLVCLQKANQNFGLALNENDMDYLWQHYQLLQKNPTLAELMMFGQVNSEHCRHKIFNATWEINGQEQAHSLFGMIKNTHAKTKEGVICAYKDNAAILKGHRVKHFFCSSRDLRYGYQEEAVHIVIKVETHNHPTAISPFAGAATGSGGEIRDEGATGAGAKPKAGLTGFSLSNLCIPHFIQPWEQPLSYPSTMASALDIILQGPLGASSFNNEFGRPNLCGYFRTLTYKPSEEGAHWGYHKPIMIAGGLGQIREVAINKSSLPPGAKIIVLGGPSMLIGLGGGAASSVAAGTHQAELDFASVQRSNPEMQRRCQEVINACVSRGDQNPIISIHDVGAGGLSNAIPELIHDSNCGGRFALTAIPVSDTSLDAMQIWCNESQERYVLALDPKDLALFEELTQRERCPYAVVGEVDSSQCLVLYDEVLNEAPVELPLNLLFGSASSLHKKVFYQPQTSQKTLRITENISELVKRVLQLPSVADKSFLITIGDRSVTGLVARDQMIGPWQVPVADVAVTASSFVSHHGEAMAMGERAPLALLDPCASVRMAIGEAITNILAADINTLSDIKLSANWMAALDYPGEDLKLYEAVKAVGLELCPALGICIPVGKDSLSMRMKWQEADKEWDVVSPLSLIISAFAPVGDIRRTLTPQLESEPSELLLIDLGFGQNRLGGSALAQVLNQTGAIPPDLDKPELLKSFFQALRHLKQEDLLLAYHDRSDGGLLATLCEMSFASHVGLTIHLDHLGEDPIANLFSEELGAVLQYSRQNKERVQAILIEHGLQLCSHVIATPNAEDKIVITFRDCILFSQNRIELHRLWSETSYRIKSLRDNPQCAKQEYDSLLDAKDPGLFASLTFESPSFYIPQGIKPKVGILREQGVNGQVEMAAAFDIAGFEAIDVHMTDIISGRVTLSQFQGVVACGGFSYGDVLGAGRGWANSILNNTRAYDEFSHFFESPSVFVLGVCNGCQMLAHLHDIIPGTSHWPRFIQNTSEQFEARLSLVKIRKSPSLFFQNMAGSILPVAVAHGEGQVFFEEERNAHSLLEANLVSLQYVDNEGRITENYPHNPNGSLLGITALTNRDGRFTLMMPHPERVFRVSQYSWCPPDWQGEHAPWLQFFINARNWVLQS